MAILLKHIDPKLQKKIRSAAAVYGLTMEVFITDILEKKMEKFPDDLGTILDEILENKEDENMEKAKEN